MDFIEKLKDGEQKQDFLNYQTIHKLGLTNVHPLETKCSDKICLQT